MFLGQMINLTGKVMLNLKMLQIKVVPMKQIIRENMKVILALMNLPLTLKKRIQQLSQMRIIKRIIYAVTCHLHQDFAHKNEENLSPYENSKNSPVIAISRRSDRPSTIEENPVADNESVADPVRMNNIKVAIRDEKEFKP